MRRAAPSYRIPDLETTLKYRLLKDSGARIRMSVGLTSIGAAPARQCGSARPRATLHADVYFGKGFGDLPDMPMAAPFAVTGQIGYQIPSWPR